PPPPRTALLASSDDNVARAAQIAGTVAARSPSTPLVRRRRRSRLCSMADTLSPTMTLRDFENGYWYLDQLKKFAERIGVPAAKKLRKDELEKPILAFVRTGKAVLPTKRSLRKTGVKEVESGINLTLRIET